MCLAPWLHCGTWAKINSLSWLKDVSLNLRKIVIILKRIWSSSSPCDHGRGVCHYSAVEDQCVTIILLNIWLHFTLWCEEKEGVASENVCIHEWLGCWCKCWSPIWLMWPSLENRADMKYAQILSWKFCRAETLWPKRDSPPTDEILLYQDWLMGALSEMAWSWIMQKNCLRNGTL